MPGLGAALSHSIRALHLDDDLERLVRLARRHLAPDQVRLPIGPPGPTAPLGQLLARDDRHLDVALAAALIAWEDDPLLDVERLVDEIEQLACQLRLRLRTSSREPSAQLELLNQFFFEDLGFSASPARTSRYGEDRLADLLLPHVLRRRRGHCVGLSAIYLALGYRAGLPLFGVSVPGHFFVRWEGPGQRQNIELTARGVSHPDAYYMDRFGVSQSLVDRGVYLQSLRRREVLIELLNNRANFYWDRGDEARVARDLDRIVQLSHNFSRAYVGRGFLAVQRDDLDAAERDLAKALALDPEESRAHLLLGQVHLRRGSLQLAERAFERATETDANNALAETYLGRVYQIRGDADRALAWHERAIKTDPRCHAAWNYLGLARQGVGDLEGAHKAFQEAKRIVPGNLRARENLVLLARGSSDEIPWSARPAFRRVCHEYEQRLQHAPHAATIKSAYARFLLGAGLETGRALMLAQQVVHRLETPHNLEVLASLLRRAGQLEEAVERLTRAVELESARGGIQTGRLEQLLAQLRAEAETPPA